MSCSTRTPEPIDRPPLIERVAFSGCDEILIGPICELTKTSSITLWIRSPATTKLQVRVDGRSVDARWVPMSTGMQTVVAVTPTPEQTAHVEIRVQDDTQTDDRRGHRTARFRLPIQHRTRPKTLKRAHEAIDRDLSAVKTDLQSLAASKDPRVQYERTQLRGKVAIREGNVADTIKHRREAAQQAGQLGLLKSQVQDLGSLAYMIIEVQRDAREARRIMDALSQVADRTDEGRATYAFYRASLARLNGDIRAYDRWLFEAEREAKRINLSTYLSAILVLRSDLLIKFGRFHEAARLYDQVYLAGASFEIERLCNLAWVALSAAEVGVSLPLDAEALARAAVQKMEVSTNKRQLPNAYVMLAMARIRAGDPKQARRYIQNARMSRRDKPTNILWRLASLEARAATLEGRFKEAELAYRRLESVAKQRDRPGPLWRAMVGIARVKEQAGHHEDALSMFAEAERQLDRQGAQALFPSPLSVSVQQQQQASRDYAGLLLDQGQPQRAVEVLLRQARRQILGVSRAVRVAALPPEARQAWNEAALQYAKLREQGDRLDNRQWGEDPTTAAETLRDLKRNARAIRMAIDRAFQQLGPTPTVTSTLPALLDELWLGYDRLRDGWLGFAWDGNHLVTKRLALDTIAHEPEALSRKLLTPFSEVLQKYRRIRLAARDRLRRIDFNTLPFRGRLLIETHRINYTLDAPQRTSLARPKRTAALIVDPDGTLPGARDEGRFVDRALEKQQVDAFVLKGPDIPRSSLIRAMAHPLLHW
ncbi:MAG: hypothetical protein AAFV29_01895, partial [Myxococcota bacterium]